MYIDLPNPRPLSNNVDLETVWYSSTKSFSPAPSPSPASINNLPQSSLQDFSSDDVTKIMQQQLNNSFQQTNTFYTGSEPSVASSTPPQILSTEQPQNNAQNSPTQYTVEILSGNN